MDPEQIKDELEHLLEEVEDLKGSEDSTFRRRTVEETALALTVAIKSLEALEQLDNHDSYSR